MKDKIAIIGLGYVGLPLAVEFSKQYDVIGFDINSKRIEELNYFKDLNREFSKNQLQNILKNTNLIFTFEKELLSVCNIFIVTVPTPINENKEPDLTLLLSASKTIGKLLKKGDLVIYESTVYPGCTEEDCVPVLEKESRLKYNQDFYCGYSPERINPGDKVRKLKDIVKVTSGSNAEIAQKVDDLYNSIIVAGTHLAPSIKVAEASKSIENAQRDINISFVNELVLMFDKMDIDTFDVLQAANTKWNFLPFKPGLVGGHCIGVDPYYLAYKSEKMGYHPSVILSGRNVNDKMGKFVASKLIKLMIEKNINVKDSKVLILGITFKENCSDIRNTKVVDVYSELIEFGVNVSIFDPHANKKEVENEYGIILLNKMKTDYSAVLIATNHDEFNGVEKSFSSETIFYSLNKR